MNWWSKLHKKKQCIRELSRASKKLAKTNSETATSNNTIYPKSGAQREFKDLLLPGKKITQKNTHSICRFAVQRQRPLPKHYSVLAGFGSSHCVCRAPPRQSSAKSVFNSAGVQLQDDKPGSNSICFLVWRKPQEHQEGKILKTQNDDN